MSGESASIADGLALAAALRSGALTEAALRAEVRARIDAINPQLNAVVSLWDADRREGPARGDPEAPFAGVPLLLKDLLGDARGTPQTMGSALLRDHVCAADSPLVLRLVGAGFRPLGRTNVPEFGFLPVTEPRLYGPCSNPWDPTRTPGGSSGGAAAAVAAGIVPLAHGTDAGGSLRIPAACCGVFALKPSRGASPLAPAQVDALGGITAEHVISRSVRDSAAVLEVTSAEYGRGELVAAAARDPAPLRIRVVTDAQGVAAPAPACVAAVHEVAALCEALGHDVAADDRGFAALVDLPRFVAALGGFVADALAQTLHGLSADLGRRITDADVEPLTWAVAERGARQNARAKLGILTALTATREALARYFASADVDVLLTPTLAVLPPRIGHFDDLQRSLDVDALFARKAALVPFTPIFNVGGQPAMSVPLVWSRGGLPIGVQFAGRVGDDARLLALAGQLERARPWRDRRPPVFVGGSTSAS